MTFGRLVSTPFFKVKFQDFFFGDVITSARLMLFDATAMACFYTSGEYKGNTPQVCTWQTGIVNYFWFILPLWWRMVQSLRRYYDDRRLKSQLVNAGKYFTGVCAGCSFVIYRTVGGGIQFVPGTNQFTGYYIAFIVLTFMSLVYSYLWDIIMDWGLFNSTKKETFGLRPVITYSRPFYYYAIVINLILRSTFAITMFINVNNYAWLTSIGYGTLMGVLELYRRWVWSLLRIENE
jgi:hypothetical protein